MKTWDRAWVCFEGVKAVQCNRRLDICTTETLPDGSVEPRMIADGPAGQETTVISEREDSAFPFSALVAGMHVVIQVCVASKRGDLHRILNSIADGGFGSTRRFSMTPQLNHPKYEEYNK